VISDFFVLANPHILLKRFSFVSNCILNVVWVYLSLFGLRSRGANSAASLILKQICQTAGQLRIFVCFYFLTPTLANNAATF